MFGKNHILAYVIRRMLLRHMKAGVAWQAVRGSLPPQWPDTKA